MDWRNFDKTTREKCRMCPRFKRTFVPPVVRERAKLAALAEAPGETEFEAAQEGRKECVLVGRSGKLEDRLLERAGIERSKISLVNTVMCYVEGNPKPTVEEMWACAPLVEKALGDAKVVLALGGTATTRVLGLKKKKTRAGRTQEKPWEVRSWRGSHTQAPETVKIGERKVLEPDVVFKSGARKGQMKPQKKAAIVTQRRREVVVSLHPAELLRTGRKAEELVVADHIRARRLASGQGLIEVGGEIHVHASAEKLANALAYTNRACVDFETAGLSGRVLCVGVAVDKDCAVVCAPKAGVQEVLRQYFGDRENVFIAHNASFDLRVMRDRFRVKVKSKLWDTMHAAAYERPDIRAREGSIEGGWDEFHALDVVASRMPNLDYYNWKQAFRSGENPDLWTYCGKDATDEWWIAEQQRKIFARSGRLERFEGVLMPLLRMLMKMEESGVQVDAQRYNELRERQEDALERVEKQWRRKLGGVNWESPKALMNLFYGQMGLKEVRTRGSKGRPGRPTMNKDAIEKIIAQNPGNEVLRLVAQMRHLKKKLSKDLHLDLALGNRARFEYNLSGTFTGRLSGNAQQFPRGIGRCKDGIKGCVCGEIRSIFVPDSNDDVLIVADFNQIEARITALMSREMWLVEAFEQEDFDYHTHTGEVLAKNVKWIAKMEEKERREYGKKANHATNYAMGVPGVMLHFKCGEEQAEQILSAIHRARPRLRKWWRELMREVEDNGEIVTPYGRIMRFKDDDRGNFELPKIAASMVQSIAAEVILDSMVDAQKRGLNVKLQAHDELVVSGRERDARVLRGVMQAKREQMDGWWCPVDVGVGENWEEAKRNAR